MVGDNGGKNYIVQDNILVDPGQYGIGVPSGENIKIINNKIYAKQQSFTNVGVYVGLQSEIDGGFACSGSTIVIQNNQVNWTNKNGVKNGWWNCGCCKVGVNSGNNWNAPISASILPATLSLNSSQCGNSNPPPVNQAPTVSITAPANNANFNAPATINITANAADANGTVTKVEFYNGASLLNSDATAPYSFSWAGVAAGTYTITAKATDNAGASTTSAAVTLKVNTPTNAAPTVSIASPSNNTSHLAPATINITANAADANGSVSKVDFYNGTSLMGSDATAPYSFTISNAAEGT